jgi:NADPH2:quinone reductase
MRAAVVAALGSRPVPKDVDEPQRAEGEALVQVTAAPINPVDVSIAAGRFYGGSPDVPYVAGKEAVGRVLESDSVATGTRVYVAGSSSGTMAERTVANDEQLVDELPDEVEDPLASCFGIAGLAGWLAVEWRGKVKEGETVLVLAASGVVGSIALQAAKLLGAGRVVAAARNPRGLERARELGADATVRLDEHDDLTAAFIEAAGGELDLTIDPLWGEPAAAASRATRFGGRLVQLGQSASKEATFESGVVRGRVLSILGHTNGAAPPEVRADAYRRMLRHAAAGELHVDYEVLPLDRVTEAWERQEASPNRKLVLAPGDVP